MKSEVKELLEFCKKELTVKIRYAVDTEELNEYNRLMETVDSMLAEEPELKLKKEHFYEGPLYSPYKNEN